MEIANTGRPGQPCDTATLRNDHGRFINDESWGHQRYGGRHH
ncbi:hypothetical protein ACLQ2D_29240 [Streptomyces sp. DT199]